LRRAFLIPSISCCRSCARSLRSPATYSMRRPCLRARGLRGSMAPRFCSALKRSAASRKQGCVRVCVCVLGGVPGGC
jgi:hypothetical protein